MEAMAVDQHVHLQWHPCWHPHPASMACLLACTWGFHPRVAWGLQLLPSGRHCVSILLPPQHWQSCVIKMMFCWRLGDLLDYKHLHVVYKNVCIMLVVYVVALSRIPKATQAIGSCAHHPLFLKSLGFLPQSALAAWHHHSGIAKEATRVVPTPTSQHQSCERVNHPLGF